MSKTTGTNSRHSLRRKVIACSAAGLVVAGGAAGAVIATQPTNPNVVSGTTLDIWSSLPEQGGAAGTTADAVRAEQLALAQANGMAGRWHVQLRTMSDSTAALQNYDLGQCESNAQVVSPTSDPKTIYEIGDFNSGCTETALATLNRAGIGSLSFSNTAVALTTGGPGVSSTAWKTFQPTGSRTYIRTVPNDSVQAAADLQAMKTEGCTSFVAVRDGSAYGNGLVDLVQQGAPQYGLTMDYRQWAPSYAPNYNALVARFRRSGVRCLFDSASTSTGIQKLTEEALAAAPTTQIFTADASCNSAFADPQQGGIPLSDDPNVHCTIATGDVAAYPGGRAFLAAFKAKYGISNPDPYAIFAYDAMQLVLSTIKKEGPNGNNRLDVIKGIFATKNRQSVLGTYSIKPDGDTTLTSYGFYGVNNGQITFRKNLTAAKTL